MMNKQLAQWFDAGKAKEALLGSDTYFLPETTYRDRHDRLLAVDQLLLWATRHGRVQDFAKAFLAALETAVADHDAWTAYDLVWSYLLVRRDHETADRVATADILHALDEVDRQYGAIPGDVVELRQRVRDELTTAP